MSRQTETNNLNYLFDPTFSKFNKSIIQQVNKLFVISFKNEGDKTSFSKYYTYC